MTTTQANAKISSDTSTKPVQQIVGATVRFAGDSGDGMQLAGTQFTNSSAVFGNDISTLPDFPAEIRAPAGSLAGVSGFQINFSSREVRTPGDQVDALIAMNPAALKANVSDVVSGGLVIVNRDAFTKNDLSKAGYQENPLDNDSLQNWKVIQVPISRINRENLADTGLSAKIVDRCKNFFALGIVYWLFGRPLDTTLNWISQKFGKNPAIADANTRALKAGYHFGETTELFQQRFQVSKAQIPPGKYRAIMGNEALALGLITASVKAGRTLFYGSYPITPASDILHALSRRKNFGVITFQAEDEIAAVTASIGAAFAGAIGVTGTSGPGIALKAEAMGLAVMTELPLVVVNVQRGGPSTGLPTKTEQADLFQALFGRNGECPMAVIAPQSPVDCFDAAIEAVRIATRFMVPVIVLSDGYIGNGAEPWRIPDPDEIPPIDIKVPESGNGSSVFHPYERDENLARPWAVPGMPGLEHRIGGLEKADVTGNVCYDPQNHHKMVELRAQKVKNIARILPPTEVQGPEFGDVLVIGWGGTCGSITSACEELREQGRKVANLHLRYLNPLPADLGDIIRRYDQVLVPELNLGQLRMLLRSIYLVDAVGLNKMQGKPFLVSEIVDKVNSMIDGK